MSEQQRQPLLRARVDTQGEPVLLLVQDRTRWDGLLIQHVGDGRIDAETVSAMVPGLRQSAAELGRAAGKGINAIVRERLTG